MKRAREDSIDEFGETIRQLSPLNRRYAMAILQSLNFALWAQTSQSDQKASTSNVLTVESEGDSEHPELQISV